MYFCFLSLFLVNQFIYLFIFNLFNVDKLTYILNLEIRLAFMKSSSYLKSVIHIKQYRISMQSW